MPANTGNQEPFVKRFEMAVMQYVILHKAQQGEVTRENLKQSFRGNLQMSSDHFDHCLDLLVQDKHLKDLGNGKYTVTDDGREDVQKLQTLVLELQDVVQSSGGGQQRQQQSVAPQKGAGGSGSSGPSGSGGATMGGGGSTGSTIGNQGGYGSSIPQGRDAGSQMGSDQPGEISAEESVSGQRRTRDIDKGGATRVREP
ncbi:MAG TPA: hypothetical protein VFH78_01670 [Candidatus Thermoplasmatota archaeon]|nr:hypothetical protein [Candidatus Thermoplasmatota archaeon]